MLRILSIIIIISFFLSSFFVGSARHIYPQKLSAWKIFEGNMALQHPAKGVVPYSLNTPLYSDYAEKMRFVKLPQATLVKYAAKGVLDFPVGTLLVKTFYYSADFRAAGKNKNLVETRLLVRETDGWQAMTYVWNDAQTDADLEIAGDDKQVQFINKAGEQQQIRYVIPNQNQCKGCHNTNDQLMPIGPSVAQLNGNINYPSGKQNQLTYWSKHGMLANLPLLSSVPKTPVWNDTASGSLDTRARAYLAINCSHCHSRQGPAQTSGLFLTEDEENLTAIGINKTPVAAGKGSGGRMVDILPGNATASIIWYRMQTEKPGERMPELGRTSIHKEGLALIKEWIDNMKNTNLKTDK